MLDDDDVDEVTGAKDVKDDEEDELPHLDDAVDVMTVEAASADRNETERRGDDAIALTPDRTETVFHHIRAGATKNPKIKKKINEK